MADIHELMVAMDLRGDLSDAELAELRWQLGLGPRPAHITEQTIVVNDVLDLLSENDGTPMQNHNGDWLLKRFPEPAWNDGSPYPAAKIGGVGFSALVRADDGYGERWALTCRWEIHPDGYGELAELFDWLAARRHESGEFFGYLRWYEHAEPDTLLSIRDGKVVARRDGAFVTPLWDGPDAD